MNLAKVLGINTVAAQAVLIGQPEITSHLDSDNNPYYAIKLKDPVLVRCSSDAEITPFETEEVFVRERDINDEGWIFIDDANPELGFYREGWVVDFSKGQQLALYQAETIKSWLKGNRTTRRDENRTRINANIRAKLEAKNS